MDKITLTKKLIAIPASLALVMTIPGLDCYAAVEKWGGTESFVRGPETIAPAALGIDVVTADGINQAFWEHIAAIPGDVTPEDLGNLLYARATGEGATLNDMFGAVALEEIILNTDSINHHLVFFRGVPADHLLRNPVSANNIDPAALSSRLENLIAQQSTDKHALIRALARLTNSFNEMISSNRMALSAFDSVVTVAAPLPTNGIMAPESDARPGSNGNLVVAETRAVDEQMPAFSNPLNHFLASTAADPALVAAVQIRVKELRHIGALLTPDATLSDIVPDTPPEPDSDKDALAFYQTSPEKLAQAAQVVRVLLAHSRDVRRDLSTRGGGSLASLLFQNNKKLVGILDQATLAIDAVAGKEDDRNNTPLGRSIAQIQKAASVKDRSPEEIRAFFTPAMDGARPAAHSVETPVAAAPGGVSDLARVELHESRGLHAPAARGVDVPSPLSRPSTFKERREALEALRAMGGRKDHEFPGQTRILFEDPNRPYDPRYDEFLKRVFGAHIVGIVSPSEAEIDQHYFNDDHPDVPEWARFYPISEELHHETEITNLQDQLALLRSLDEARHQAGLKNGKTLADVPLPLKKGQSAGERAFLKEGQASAVFEDPSFTSAKSAGNLYMDTPFITAGSVAVLQAHGIDVQALYETWWDTVYEPTMRGKIIGGRSSGKVIAERNLVQRLLKGESEGGAFLNDWYITIYRDPSVRSSGQPGAIIGGYIAKHLRKRGIFGGSWAAYTDKAKNSYHMSVRTYIVSLQFIEQLNRIAKEAGQQAIRVLSFGSGSNFFGGYLHPNLMQDKNKFRMLVYPYGPLVLQKVLDPSKMFNNMMGRLRIGWILHVLRPEFVQRYVEYLRMHPGASLDTLDLLLLNPPRNFAVHQHTYDPRDMLPPGQVLEAHHFTFDRRSTRHLLTPRDLGRIRAHYIPKRPYLDAAR